MQTHFSRKARQCTQLHIDLGDNTDFTASVRTFRCLVLVSVTVLTDCASHPGKTSSFSDLPPAGRASISLPNDKVTMAPDTLLIGRVAKVNADGRFAVVTFPIGHLPGLHQEFSVYRRGVKVGDLRITGPQLDDNVVADLASGDAQVGDEVRSQ